MHQDTPGGGLWEVVTIMVTITQIQKKKNKKRERSGVRTKHKNQLSITTQ